MDDELIYFSSSTILFVLFKIKQGMADQLVHTLPGDSLIETPHYAATRDQSQRVLGHSTNFLEAEC